MTNQNLPRPSRIRNIGRKLTGKSEIQSYTYPFGNPAFGVRTHYKAPKNPCRIRPQR